MASTNFKVFNEANDQATTYTDAEYLNATQRLNGVTPGIAISRMHNKMYFQWSVMATAIAQYLVSRGYDAMDYDLDSIKEALENACGLNVRQNSAQYQVGDIKYSAALASYLFLECTVAGTSASSIPAAFATAVEGDTIVDGTVTWIVRRTISLADVKNLMGYRLPSTAYNVGDMRYTEGLPPLWFLYCSTAGTTASSSITLPSPLVENAEVTDGTVVWETKKVGTRETIPAYNRRIEITTSGTYAAPDTGWYKITLKGGGGGGQGANYVASTFVRGGAGGGEGGTTIAYEYMHAGDSVDITVGAGGSGTATVSGVQAASAGGSGGTTTVEVNGNTYSATGGDGGNLSGGNGGTGTIRGMCGTGRVTYTKDAMTYTAWYAGGVGGGAGGRYVGNGFSGGGGAGGTIDTDVSPVAIYAGGAGGNGYVWFEYWAD